MGSNVLIFIEKFFTLRNNLTFLSKKKPKNNYTKALGTRIDIVEASS